ncbi:MAG: zinc ribbon domain-containing protein [Methanomassiliicoccaceae archaeon]|nr:zinc ribbon domain-containing protein [Methanomassiliicoccaceae archaeon]
MPEGCGFCYACGRKRDNSIRLDDEGGFIRPEKGVCASCGADLPQGAEFCGSCGQPSPGMPGSVFMPHMAKYGWIGVLLAVVPGLLGLLPDMSGTMMFSVFGLGHLYFRKWSRGFLYLMVSALMYLMKSSWGVDASFWSAFIVGSFTLFVCVIQALETIVLAYQPPKKEA